MAADWGVLPLGESTMSTYNTMEADFKRIAAEGCLRSAEGALSTPHQALRAVLSH